MAEAKHTPSALRRSRQFSALAVIFVAALIVLSSVSLYLFLRSEDFRGAKYRSQSAIVSEMSSTMVKVLDELRQVDMESLSNQVRTDNADWASFDSDSLSDCAYFVRSQYDANSRQWIAFAAIMWAFYDLEDLTQRAYQDLVAQPSVETGYSMDWHLRINITLSIPLIQDLQEEFSRAISQASAPGYNQIPSSVVDAMDLDLVRELGFDIIYAVGGTNPLI